MLIDIFVPTGEVRAPNKDEWFRSNMNDGWVKSDGLYSTQRTIGIRHQVEVPNDTEYISIWDSFGNGLSRRQFERIMLPRPKKKIKKWRWVMKDAPIDSYYVTNYGHATAEEAERKHPSGRAIMKIPETEIEVSE